MSTTEKLLTDFINNNKMSDVEFVDYVKSIIPQIQSRISSELSKEVFVEFDDVLHVHLNNKDIKFNVMAFNEVMALHKINLEDEIVHFLVAECNYMLKNM